MIKSYDLYKLYLYISGVYLLNTVFNMLEFIPLYYAFTYTNLYQ